MMHLMTWLMGNSYHAAGWRHGLAWERTTMRLDVLVEVAKMAEQAKMDALFIADGNAVRNMDKIGLFEANTPSARPAVFDPVTLMAAISQHTEHIGLVSTASTTYESPWSVARRYASLDHLSNGRAAWNVVTGSNPGDSQNFGLEHHPNREERYARAEEFVEACTALWNSWEPDAFVERKDTGQYLDSSKVRTADYKGEHLSVKGPLNVARSPQGRPVLFHAGQSEGGRRLAARHADCIFAAAANVEAAREFTTDLKRRRAELGGDPDQLRIIVSVAIYLGRTEDESTALYHELNALIDPGLGVDFLAKAVSEDLSGYPIDGPMPDLAGPVVGGNSIRGQLDAIAKAEHLTIRQLYERVVPSVGNAALIGTATQVADVMEEWFRTGACDGFVLGASINPFTLRLIRDELVPELQRRGLFRTDYTGSTLREHLGLRTTA
ncbi:FMN-dependent oxidoreductase (nitrilotriacetate monooxygenase family) [Kribbella sp. VKM Ac-2568]|nr:FMN-dependent oxidoreductase (nitrilotriacetate monooxygenase family) [Kribbella sp. VKM Ac-2568]